MHGTFFYTNETTFVQVALRQSKNKYLYIHMLYSLCETWQSILYVDPFHEESRGIPLTPSIREIWRMAYQTQLPKKFMETILRELTDTE